MLEKLEERERLGEIEALGVLGILEGVEKPQGGVETFQGIGALAVTSGESGTSGRVQGAGILPVAKIEVLGGAGILRGGGILRGARILRVAKILRGIGTLRGAGTLAEVEVLGESKILAGVGGIGGLEKLEKLLANLLAHLPNNPHLGSFIGSSTDSTAGPSTVPLLTSLNVLRTFPKISKQSLLPRFAPNSGAVTWALFLMVVSAPFLTRNSTILG